MPKTTSTTSSITPKEKIPRELSKAKREKCREKEFRRAQKINEAFDDLQQKIPHLKPEERRHLPKIKTLRLAMHYISHLNKLLNGNEMVETDCDEIPRPLTHLDFRMTVASEMRVRNSYRERAHSQEMDPAMVQRILAREEQRRRCNGVIQHDGQDFNSRHFGPICTNSYNYRHSDSEDVMQFIPVPNYPISPNYYYFGQNVPINSGFPQLPENQHPPSF